jgi:hypothetical protein
MCFSKIEWKIDIKNNNIVLYHGKIIGENMTPTVKTT